MPQQEVFFEQVAGERRVEVLKTYDRSYAREAFGDMDDAAQAFLWNTLGINEAHDVVSEANGHRSRSVYVSPDWPSAEAFAKSRIAAA
jgi:Mg/Co/Ni transporter MgtE